MKKGPWNSEYLIANQINDIYDMFYIFIFLERSSGMVDIRFMDFFAKVRFSQVCVSIQGGGVCLSTGPIWANLIPNP